MDTRKSDAELVRAARGGDKEAFATLFGRHRPLLVALCRRALGDPVLSEDATQEAALTAMLNLDRLRRTDRFGPWLGGIGLNICRRLLRERSRDAWSWEALHGGRRESQIPDGAPGLEELAEAADIAARTRDAIAVLPPGQRAAVVLFYLSDMTHAETAALLGIEVNAVKTRLHKARKTLKRQLSVDDRDRDRERIESMDERLTRRTLAKTAAVLTGGTAVSHTSAGHAATNEGETMAGHQESATLVEMRVVDVRRKPAVSGRPSNHVVLLEELGGTRRLPIWVGQPEGTAIAMQLEQVQMPRPLTVAFTANLLRASGGTLREVRIDRLVDTVFYATAVIETGEETSTIDARPSDAINLALLTGASIRVDPAILEVESPQVDAPNEISEGSPEIVAELLASWESPSSASSE